MHISSRDFIHQQFLPPKCTSEGGNISPSLVFQNVPHGTQSLVIVMQSAGLAGDTSEEGKYHWLVWNIPPGTGFIPSGTVPEGAVVGINDYWEAGYGGPYPPAGECHKYRITVYALDTILNLSFSAPKEELLQAMHNHIIDQDKIEGYYQRKN